MFYVEWKSGFLPGKIHFASNHLKTFCNKRIPKNATEFQKLPRDKTRVCMLCRKVEEEERPFRD